MSCPNYKIIFNDETNYVAQDISEEPVVRVIPVKGEQGETGPKGEDGKNFEPTIVSELPATGDESKLYLTPKAHTTSTATGNPITATVTEQAGQLESFQLDGNTFQQTYTGKNLLQFIPQSSQGMTVTYDAKTGLAHVSGTNSSNDGLWANICVSVECSIPAGTYTLSVTETQSNLDFHIRLKYTDDSIGDFYISRNNTSKTFKMPKDAKRVYIWYGGLTPAFSSVDFTVRIQLEAGSTATSFEPYVGGQASPNPDYPQTIQTVTGEQTVTVVGKNLIDPSQAVLGTIDASTGNIVPWSGDTNMAGQEYIPVKPNTAYTLSVNSSWNFLRLSEYTADKANIQRTQAASSTYLTITTTANTHYLRWSANPQGAAITNPTAMVNSGKMQLELGSTATAYEPYSSNDYEINLGKNLYDGSVYKTDYILGATGSESYSKGAVITDPMEVEPNTAYTASAIWHSGKGDTYIRIGVYDKSMGWVVRYSGQLDRITFTTPANARYIRLSYYRDRTDSVQLELGSTPTSYAAYFTPIELCKLGTYQDYIWKDGEDWKLHKAIGKYVFTGEEASTWDSTIPRIYLSSGQLSDINIHPVFPENANTLPFAVTNKFSIKTFASFYTSKESNGFAMSTQGKNFNFGDKSWTQKSDGQADINGAIVYYALETATDTTITDTTLISQFEAIKTASLENGTSTIMNSTPSPNLTGDMEISYYSYNPRNRYDKWLWLDINNEYEQLNNPDTTPSLSSTRNLNLTNIQSDLNEINNDEEQEDVTFNDAEEEER